MGKSFTQRLREKGKWAPGDLLCVSPRACRYVDFTLVGDLFSPTKIARDDIVVFLESHENESYFYLMTPGGARVEGMRQDFTRIGNVKEVKDETG